MRHTCAKIFLMLISVFMICCNKKDEFTSFNGAINGTVKDAGGIPLYGDLNSNNIIIRLLGENDKSTTDIRLNGVGDYQNLKMFPKKYKLWIEGPIVKFDTLMADLIGQNVQVKNFTAIPLILPKISKGSVSGTTINVDYSLTPNAGNIVDKKEIYCSSVPFPTAATGSRTNVYVTKTVALTTDAGSVPITSLTPGKYYVRIGVKAKTAILMNYSNQIELTVL